MGDKMFGVTRYSGEKRGSAPPPFPQEMGFSRKSEMLLCMMVLFARGGGDGITLFAATLGVVNTPLPPPFRCVCLAKFFF